MILNEDEEELEIEDIGDITFLPANQFQSYVHCDDNIECYGQLTEGEIVEAVLRENEKEDVENEVEEILDDENQETRKNEDDVDLKSALEALNILQKYLQQKNIGCREEIETVEEKIFSTEIKKKTVQSKITKYFLKD